MPVVLVSALMAMEDGALRSLLSRLDADRKPLLVQLPRAKYQRLKKEWGLPPGRSLF